MASHDNDEHIARFYASHNAWVKKDADGHSHRISVFVIALVDHTGRETTLPEWKWDATHKLDDGIGEEHVVHTDGAVVNNGFATLRYKGDKLPFVQKPEIDIPQKVVMAMPVRNPNNPDILSIRCEGYPESIGEFFYDGLHTQECIDLLSRFLMVLSKFSDGRKVSVIPQKDNS